MDFIKAIENATGRKADIQLMPMQPGDVKRTWADVDQLGTAYNYKPQTTVDQGINNFFNWYREYFNLS